MHFQMLPWLSQRLARWLAQVPSQCAACHAWPAQRICTDCVARFATPAHRCQRCAIRLPSGVPLCGACVLRPPTLDACVAAVDYAYPWVHALADFKFHADPGWAAPLALRMRSAPQAEQALARADVVLPIPLSQERLQIRGFNQAALLAQHLSPHKTQRHSLLRIQATDAQSGLSRAQRLRNLQGAFAVEPLHAPRLRGQRVVLVDDVMTTGATLEAAASTLRQAGVAHITGLVFARTGLH